MLTRLKLFLWTAIPTGAATIVWFIWLRRRNKPLQPPPARCSTDTVLAEDTELNKCQEIKGDKERALSFISQTSATLCTVDVKANNLSFSIEKKPDELLLSKSSVACVQSTTPSSVMSITVETSLCRENATIVKTTDSGVPNADVVSTCGLNNNSHFTPDTSLTKCGNETIADKTLSRDSVGTDDAISFVKESKDLLNGHGLSMDDNTGEQCDLKQSVWISNGFNEDKGSTRNEKYSVQSAYGTGLSVNAVHQSVSDSDVKELLLSNDKHHEDISEQRTAGEVGAAKAGETIIEGGGAIDVGGVNEEGTVIEGVGAKERGGAKGVGEIKEKGGIKKGGGVHEGCGAVVADRVKEGSGMKEGGVVKRKHQFDLPSELCGLMIGRQGAHINQLKQRSGAVIQLKARPSSNLYHTVTIEGTEAQVEKALELIRIKFPPTRYANVDISLCRPDVIPAGPILSNEIMQLSLPMGVALDVYVSTVVSPNHVFVQQPTHPTYPDLERLGAEMNRCYGSFPNNINHSIPGLPMPLEVGVICVSPVCGAWRRAQIVNITTQMDECDIKLVDVGGYLHIDDVSQLKQIRMDFMQLPFQAIECYLDGVIPPTDDDDFPLEAKELLETWTRGCILTANVTRYEEDGVPYIHLINAASNNQVTFINRQLVDYGVARWIEM